MGMFIVLVMIPIIPIIANIYLYINKKYIIRKVNKEESIEREINIEYSPAVLSYLYNHKLSFEKDALASLLDMKEKGYIDIIFNENKYEFISKTQPENIKNEDERYLYNTLINKNEKFEYEEWKNSVLKEYEKFGFKDNQFRKSKIIINTLVIIASDIIIVYYSYNNKMLDDVAGNIMLTVLSMGSTICFDVMLQDYINNLIKKHGTSINQEKELKKIYSLKKFMKEYTLLEERKTEDVILFGRYIPYAMVIEENKDYRNKSLKMVSVFNINEIMFDKLTDSLKDVYNVFYGE